MKNKLLIMLLLAGFCAQATELTKAEKKKVLAKLKTFKKNPQKYARMIADYENTIDSNQIAIKNWRDEALTAATKQVAIEQEIMKLKQELAACNNRPVPTCPDYTNVPKTGVVYKVQLGLYDKFNMNGFFEKPKFIGVENVEGMNRYTVNYFESENEARNFLRDIRLLGIKDAFVARYENGQRMYEWEKNERYKTKRPISVRDAVSEAAPVAKPTKIKVAAKTEMREKSAYDFGTARKKQAVEDYVAKKSVTKSTAPKALPVKPTTEKKKVPLRNGS